VPGARPRLLQSGLALVIREHFPVRMPELEWSFGYPLALGAMLVVCVSLYRWFRHIDWL
jgi:hypothetical protein